MKKIKTDPEFIYLFIYFKVCITSESNVLSLSGGLELDDL